jgi:long-chain acyl-CoA synthetase
MLTRVQVGIAESTWLKRRLFDFFVPRAVAIERDRLSGKRIAPWRLALRALGEVAVFAPLKDFLGLSRAQRAYTAGEAIGEDTFLFFRALGVDLRQFYGQTETSALTAAQDAGAVRLHTVGKPLPGIELRTDETGEILVRGPGVFDGYLNDAEATRQALSDGWLHTGDAGYLEADGQLVVLGRISEVVHTAGGERFIPNYIENRLKFSPYIRNVAVLGAARPFLAAIVCIDIEAAGHWAQTHGVAYTSYADLSQKSETYALVAAAIRHVNELLPPGLAIRRFVNLHKDFDPDDGEITRTRKLRRATIEARYAALIAALYDPSAPAEIDFAASITYESGATGALQRRLQLREVA